MVYDIPDRGHTAAGTSALRAGVTYLLAGVVWIVVSDHVATAVVHDPHVLSRLQTLKGWFFVAASAGFIWWLVRREVGRLRRSEAHLAAFGEQSIAGTYVIVEGRLVHANARFAHIFGYPLRRLEGMPALELVVEGERERLSRSLLEDEGDGLLLATHRFTGLCADGSTADLELFGRAVDWGGRRAVAGLVLDVTERVRLEEKLRQAARVDALGNLTGAVAHDFNNFLTGILGNLDLMLSDPEGGSRELRANLELVRDSAARAASLTGQLLTFSRGRVFHHRPIDPNRHLQELAGFLESLCQGGQRLVLDLEDRLPPVVLDPVALDQLVVNLFVNAKDAVGSQGTITIRTKSERAPRALPEVHIEVVDDGVGIAAPDLSRIFEPFFTTKERGTGLGLATVRSIVDEVRGHLAVDSESGRGTTVRASFPAAAGAVSERSGSTPAATVTALASPPATILIVDDDDAVRKVVSAALKRIGHRTLVAPTAAEAERTLVAARGEIDLVISDVSLPDVSGPELVAAMRREHPGLRVLFTSGCRPAETSEHFELLSVSPFLDKPFSLEDLRSAVAEALGSTGPRRESSAM
jgi:two-component system cell cycle sensor histidine kinase/response regulator CckA